MRVGIRRGLGIAVALACAFWSICIFQGWVLPELPNRYRMLFGTGTVLYGMYRLVLGFVKRPEPDGEDQ
jgi:hypothetical protein